MPLLLPKRQEAHGLARQAQRDLKGPSFSPRGRSVGEVNPILRGWVKYDGTLESVFLAYLILGSSEDTAPSGPGVSTSRLWLEAVEPGMRVGTLGLFSESRVLHRYSNSASRSDRTGASPLI
jgi:hypothetical protein